MKAIIGGSSLFKTHIFKGWMEKSIKTPYGEVLLKIKGDNIFIQRHGLPPVPPHRINHRANIWALKTLGTEKIVSINSVGSLKIRLKPGKFVIPHDFISIWDVPTFYEDEARYIVPMMDKGARDYLTDECRKIDLVPITRGIYIQTRGPRLETKAEINLLKGFGDIVGMTMASEATLCMEQGIPYASLCSIDNYCHGIIKKPLTMEELEKNWQENLKTIERLLIELIRH